MTSQLIITHFVSASLSFTASCISLQLYCQQLVLSFNNPSSLRVLPVTYQHTHKVRDWLLNIDEQLVDKEPDISLRSWWRPEQKLKEGECCVYYVEGNTIPK